MAKLIYTAISSLDGYVADAEGNFDWSVPDEEVHRFVNDLERPIGTYLLGVGSMRSCVIGIPHRLAMTSRQQGRSTRRSAGSGQDRVLQESGPDIHRQYKD